MGFVEENFVKFDYVGVIELTQQLKFGQIAIFVRIAHLAVVFEYFNGTLLFGFFAGGSKNTTESALTYALLEVIMIFNVLATCSDEFSKVYSKPFEEMPPVYLAFGYRCAV